MWKRNKTQYVVLDLGERISVDELLQENQSTLALEIHRENQMNPYSRYYVQRVIPCKFEQGKLQKY